jgi:hypothetical protein
MSSDPITDEIRAIRRQLAAQCGNDIRRIFEDARQREKTDGNTYVSLPPRRIPTTPPTPLPNSVEIPASDSAINR